MQALPDAKFHAAKQQLKKAAQEAAAKLKAMKLTPPLEWDEARWTAEVTAKLHHKETLCEVRYLYKTEARRREIAAEPDKPVAVVSDQYTLTFALPTEALLTGALERSPPTAKRAPLGRLQYRYYCVTPHTTQVWSQDRVLWHTGTDGQANTYVARATWRQGQSMRLSPLINSDCAANIAYWYCRLITTCTNPVVLVTADLHRWDYANTLDALSQGKTRLSAYEPEWD